MTVSLGTAFAAEEREPQTVAVSARRRLCVNVRSLGRWTVMRSWSSSGWSFIETECLEPTWTSSILQLRLQQTRWTGTRTALTQTPPGSIYNSWRDLVAPLREERGEFTPWPNYTLLPFAPSAPRSSQKAECMTSAHSKVLSAFRADGLFLKKPTFLVLSLTHIRTYSQTQQHTLWLGQPTYFSDRAGL